jgi:protein tyrosine phosphatase type IVA
MVKYIDDRMYSHYSKIDSKNYTFVIFDSPNDVRLPKYVNEIVKNGPKATVWVHACDRMYETDVLLKEGVQVYDLRYDDGKTPDRSILDRWSKILGEHVNETIAVHCIAGLGRAPLLVAIAMIEDGWDALSAIQEIRRMRPGALNMPQIKFLEVYKKSKRVKSCLLL